MGEKYCIVMICLVLKQKRSWHVKPIHQNAKSTNEQNKCLKQNSSALLFLEEAADFGCQISLRNGHFLRCFFLTESVDKLIKRLTHFKITPKSSSNFFCLFFSFCFKITNQVRSPTSSSTNSFVTELLSVCSPHCALNTVSAAPVCPLFRKESTFTICTPWNLHTLTNCYKPAHPQLSSGTGHLL